MKSRCFIYFFHITLLFLQCQHLLKKIAEKVDILFFNGKIVITRKGMYAMTVGERIRQRRKELGMSQTDLAEKLGYKSKSSVNKIENGVYNLKQSKIVALADALYTTPGYIMGWEDDEIRICELFEQCYGKEAFAVVTDFLQLDQVDRENVHGIIRVMLDNDKYREKEQAM